MGMKEEIFSIATALGYDGPTPTSKTKAVHAVAQAVEEGGGGGGGEAGYDVTKVWAVPEQTVTTEIQQQAPMPPMGVAQVEIAANLMQMYEDGKTDFVIEVDGESASTTLQEREGVGGTIVYVIGGNGGWSITATYTDGELTEAHITIRGEAQPTTHTVSAYHMDVTTTADFDAAVNKAAKPSEIGALEYMGMAILKTPRDSSITVGAGESYQLDTTNCNLSDEDIVEKYGSSYQPTFCVINQISLPDGFRLDGFSSYPLELYVTNVTNSAYTFDGLNQDASVSAYFLL